eukprot:gnl/TRDRNA2_/TRDRNA2_181531_c0_seq1.p1 gnl/TRDRNA2_/TRDRNA2_181531_c0~~gnl/TRDRNA2_/TRDRNA2_181531_c0_seq1.p1  ORF type:complete len:232 (+),score=23.54 gnl/TRDRNA2_/TRDRNA2_181531_c0_seq1:60-755(+)
MGQGAQKPVSASCTDREGDACQNASASDSQGTMTITFKKVDGEMVDKTFVRRPLGMDFYKVAPIVIKKIQKNGHAEELGIEIGWTLICINGEVVLDQDFALQFAKLRQGSLPLPDRVVALPVGPPKRSPDSEKDSSRWGGESPAASTRSGTTRTTTASSTPAHGSSGSVTPVGIASAFSRAGQMSAVFATLADLEAAERGESFSSVVPASLPSTPTSQPTSSRPSTNKMQL